MPKHALIVYNPAAGNAIDPSLWLGILTHRLCTEGKYIVSTIATEESTAPTELLQAISEPFDLLVAAGGDGTVRIALSAVAEKKLDIPVALVPLGTGNQLARNLSIFEENILSDPLESAIKVMLTGKPRRIDLGVMNGQHFCVAAGVGSMSDAIVAPDGKDKANWKMLAYASSMIQAFALPPAVFRLSIEAEQFEVSASGIFITNVSDLGAGTLSESAQLNDGLLDLCILNPSEFQDYLQLGFHFAGGFIGGKAPYYIRKVKTLMIEVLPTPSRLSTLQRVGHKIRSIFQSGKILPRKIPRELMAMIDGDSYGTTPMHISIEPKAVNVLVPENY